MPVTMAEGEMLIVIFSCFAKYPLTGYLALWLNIVVWCSEIPFRELTRTNRCLPR
jgi:hypothetical protein